MTRTGCRLAGAGALALVLAAARAKAQDEVIEDPELASRRGDSTQTPEAGSASRRVRFVARLEQRIATDLHWSRSGEDVLDARTIVQLEGEHAPSRSVALRVGARALHRLRAANGPGGGVQEPRWELSLEPWETYADLGAGAVRARLGYQVLAWGRMDVAPAADLLGRYDLRWIATPTATDTRVPVLAAALDWDATERVSLSLAYVPFFEGHRVDVLGGDAALAQWIAGPAAPGIASLEGVVDPSWRTRLGDVLAHGPAPSLAHPQAAARATLRGRAGELTVTAGTALEHLPAIALEAGGPQVRYPRYWQLALDGASTVGPFVVSFEAGWSPRRTLYAASDAAPLPAPASAPLVQTAVRVEWLRSDSLFAEVEAFSATPTRAPAGDAQWIGLLAGRALHGVLAMGRWAPLDADVALEVDGLVLDGGPSWIGAARASWRPGGGWELEVGASVFEGPPLDRASPRTWSLAGLLDEQDQAYLTVRWAR